MKAYTICLVGLDRERSVVVGGGRVALRKVEGLLEADARVRVISPELVPGFGPLVESGSVEVVRRLYQEGDLEGAFLVIAATDDPQVNQAVWEEALGRGCLVNVVDDPAHCNFILPAVVRRGDLSIAVSTGGSSPALARRLRESLEEQYGPEYAELVALLGELRPSLLADIAPGRARLQAALRLIDSDLLETIRQEGRQAAEAYALELLQNGEIDPH